MFRNLMLIGFSISFVGIFFARIIRGDFDTVVFIFIFASVMFFILKDIAIRREERIYRKKLASRGLRGL